MVVIKRSMVDGTVNQMEFDMTDAEYEACYTAWQNGVLIQDAFPMLSIDEREFIMTGITPEQWDETFNDE